MTGSLANVKAEQKNYVTFELVRQAICWGKPHDYFINFRIIVYTHICMNTPYDLRPIQTFQRVFKFSSAIDNRT